LVTDIATLGVQEANKVGISHGHAPIGAHEPDAPRSTAQLRQHPTATCHTHRMQTARMTITTVTTTEGHFRLGDVNCSRY